MIDPELERSGVRLLPQSEIGIATVRSATIAGRLHLSPRASLLVVHVVVDFGSNVARRAVLALVVGGDTRSAITVRGESVAELARILDELGREIAFGTADDAAAERAERGRTR